MILYSASGSGQPQPLGFVGWSRPFWKPSGADCCQREVERVGGAQWVGSGWWKHRGRRDINELVCKYSELFSWRFEKDGQHMSTYPFPLFWDSSMVIQRFHRLFYTEKRGVCSVWEFLSWRGWKRDTRSLEPQQVSSWCGYVWGAFFWWRLLDFLDACRFILTSQGDCMSFVWQSSCSHSHSETMKTKQIAIRTTISQQER